MGKRILPVILAAAVSLGVAWTSYGGPDRVVREGDRTYIVDMMGERWEVTDAESLGFDPRGFQYGIGRHAFVPLDDLRLREGDEAVPGRTRVIGIREGSDARAYSVPTLRSHEIANSSLGGKPVAVGY